MREVVPYIEVPGSRKDHEITVYALSTCAFCRRAMEFLRNNRFTFRYIYMDEIDKELQLKIKENLTAMHGKRILYPYTIVDNSEVLTGFIEADWKLTLGLDD